ncbi:MAG TPA: helix-turn-helix domain-containing protein [Mesorhizobium sp.]
MDIRPIRTDEDHYLALKEIEALWNADAGTPEADKLEVLAILVEDYEARRFRIDGDLSPIQVLQLAITEMGRSQAELSAILGSRSRTSEILSGKRSLTTDAVYRISKAWRIPADLLVGLRTSRQAA